MGAALLEAEGNGGKAESEYFAAFRALQEAGCGGSAHAGSVLNGVGSLYIKERRWDDAQEALDRALAIFTRAPDAVPMDRVKLLNVRGVLRAREAEWLEAERDLANALSIADREPRVDPTVLRWLLSNYAEVLRRNHRRHDVRWGTRRGRRNEARIGGRLRCSHCGVFVRSFLQLLRSGVPRSRR